MNGNEVSASNGDDHATAIDQGSQATQNQLDPQGQEQEQQQQQQQQHQQGEQQSHGRQEDGSSSDDDDIDNDSDDDGGGLLRINDPLIHEVMANSFLKSTKLWTSYKNVQRRLEQLPKQQRQRQNQDDDDGDGEDERSDSENNNFEDALEYVRELLTREDNGSKNNLPEYGQWKMEQQQQQQQGPPKDGDETMITNQERSKDEEEKLSTGPSTSLKSTSMSLEELSKILFQPGMKFRGHICVPGLSGSFSDHHEDVLGGSDHNVEAMNHANNDSSRSNENEEVSNAVNDNDRSSMGGDRRTSSSSEQNEAQEEEEDSVGKIYELVILERGKDELGNEYLLASHSAYGDEQCVHIQIKFCEAKGDNNKQQKDDVIPCDSTKDQDDIAKSKKILEVEYADGETCCIGRWDTKEFRFKGHVRQRLQANDGIFHASEVTHVFTLHPCTARSPTGLVKQKSNGEKASKSSSRWREEDLLSRDTKAIVTHRHRTYNAIRSCLQTFLVLFHSLRITATDMRKLHQAVAQREEPESPDVESFLNKKQQLLWKLCDIDWTKLLLEAFRVGGERLCAEFRFRAGILDGQVFDTTKDREDFVHRWTERKMDLSAAHENWESREFLMNALAQMVYIFENDLYQSYGIRYRLRASYEFFEVAYRRAEGRLPKEELAKYEISVEQQRQQQGLDENTVCIICQCALIDEENASEEKDGPMGRLYRLPCSHYFHEECVQQWLHYHSSCPVCRHDLTPETEEECRMS
mmetsp:Transcript_1314/g.2457  ORF Transcript_1314/g.2457 Transcript_1314/m.2457 type:complete len:750 (-) Transcript_1314:45-2294(-)